MRMQVLLILVLLSSTSTDVRASDFDDGLVAFKSQNYATAFKKFLKVVTAPSPPFDEWLAKARSANPGLSDEDLISHWQKTYGSGPTADRTRAQFYLGTMYEWGYGVPQNSHIAVQWYTLAAEAGLPDAQFNLGVLYTQGRGVPQDYQKAAQWYTLAAEAGLPDAQLNLGVLYTQGRGVPQDYRTALLWYRRAADQGNSQARYNLGLMYAFGHGVPQDYVQAHKWFNLAAASANDAEVREKAASQREIVARKMTPQQVSQAQQLAREWKPQSAEQYDGGDTQPHDVKGEATPASTGTGFVVSRQGHVLTNHHVIEGCQTVRASVEGRMHQVTVVGSDPVNDLAVLQLPTPVPSVARFREGRTIRPGDSASLWSAFPCQDCWRLKHT